MVEEMKASSAASNSSRVRVDSRMGNPMELAARSRYERVIPGKIPSLVGGVRMLPAWTVKILEVAPSRTLPRGSMMMASFAFEA